MLCGARSYGAIAEWGRNYGAHIARALGFRHLPPCAATLHLIFRRLDCAGFEAQLGAWAESVVASTSAGTGRPQAAEPAVALDGKTLRGSRKQGAPGVHLLSALAHQVGVTLAQQAVADKTNEIMAVETVLSQLVLTGRVVTMDALLTQRAVAQTIVDAGGDYVMIVKANQPQLRSDIELIWNSSLQLLDVAVRVVRTVHRVSKDPPAVSCKPVKWPLVRTCVLVWHDNSFERKLIEDLVDTFLIIFVEARDLLAT